MCSESLPTICNSEPLSTYCNLIRLVIRNSINHVRDTINHMNFVIQREPVVKCDQCINENFNFEIK